MSRHAQLALVSAPMAGVLNALETVWWLVVGLLIGGAVYAAASAKLHRRRRGPFGERFMTSMRERHLDRLRQVRDVEIAELRRKDRERGGKISDNKD